MSDLRKDIIKGVKWNAVGDFSNVLLTFLIGIILSRLLTATDYGIVGMISIFFIIANTFVDSGFGLALIRKKILKDEDSSTVFFFNIFISFLCYFILYGTAPYISIFFNTQLTDIIRISGLSLPIGALGMVHFALLTRNVDFKTPSIIYFISNIISGSLGIYLAFLGYGVWSLVMQSLSNTIIRTILVCYLASWHPQFVFSFNSFRELFGFGSKILGSKLLDKFFSNLTTFAIGKCYSPSDLGYYSKGQGTATLPSSFLYNIIGSVSMPVLSKLQDNDELLIAAYRKYIKICSLIIFFLMTLLITIAKPMVVLLYSDRWLPSVIYLQIFCLNYMFYHIHAININLLLVKGRSDLNLKIEIIKNSIAFLALVVALPFGVIFLCLSFVVSSQLSLIINTYYTGKIFNFGYLKQWKDFSPYLIYSLIACGPSYIISNMSFLPILKILIGTILSTTLYFSFLLLIKDKNLIELIRITPINKIFKYQ